MSTALEVLDITFEAGEDLSGDQYKAVYLSDDNTVKLQETAEAASIGILQNEPETNEAAVVRVLGVSKAYVGESISAGKRCYVAADAMLMEEDAVDDSEVCLIGIMLGGAGADGDIAEVLLSQISFVT